MELSRQAAKKFIKLCVLAPWREARAGNILLAADGLELRPATKNPTRWYIGYLLVGLQDDSGPP